MTSLLVRLSNSLMRVPGGFVGQDDQDKESVVFRVTSDSPTVGCLVIAIDRI